ncbi:MAG: hypothetical protein LBS71_02350 [Puniceicoccales bacterium]|jgi:hypothetical protein|nr:hypothetical protein [Puniceicoccales bacterium]
MSKNKIISYIGFGLLATSVVQGNPNSKDTVADLIERFNKDELTILHHCDICDENGLFNKSTSRENFDRAFICFFQDKKELNLDIMQ